jgi:hypothetical protein
MLNPTVDDEEPEVVESRRRREGAGDTLAEELRGISQPVGSEDSEDAEPVGAADADADARRTGGHRE